MIKWVEKGGSLRSLESFRGWLPTTLGWPSGFEEWLIAKMFFGWLPDGWLPTAWYADLWWSADCHNVIPPGSFSGKTETTKRASERPGSIRQSIAMHLPIGQWKILRKQWQCNRIAMARWPFETSQKEQWFQEARRLGKFKFPKFLREEKCEAHTLLSSRNSYAGQTLLFNSHVVIIRGILK